MWLLVLLQLALGVGGFGLAPEGVFPALADDPLAALTLRLAVWSNAGQVLMAAAVLWLWRDPRAARLVAASYALYHLLAGLDGLRVALGWVDVDVTPSPLGPVISHGLMGALALLALLYPARSTS